MHAQHLHDGGDGDGDGDSEPATLPAPILIDITSSHPMPDLIEDFL
jgi:hypothetical protein